nr:MAG TPA: hypothetical protein [Caudoviricetes sp.]DAN83463.1 MAG TPA: hypothetical protein [Caudoviricetes sp.]DAZ55859.1 MAG TPA: hypothetical protein [Caudoviricetes sp.]
MAPVTSTVRRVSGYGTSVNEMYSKKIFGFRCNSRGTVISLLAG